MIFFIFEQMYVGLELKSIICTEKLQKKALKLFYVKEWRLKLDIAMPN